MVDWTSMSANVRSLTLPARSMSGWSLQRSDGAASKAAPLGVGAFRHQCVRLKNTRGNCNKQVDARDLAPRDDPFRLPRAARSRRANTSASYCILPRTVPTFGPFLRMPRRSVNVTSHRPGGCADPLHRLHPPQKKDRLRSLSGGPSCSRGGRIRTGDLLVPNQAL